MKFTIDVEGKGIAGILEEASTINLVDFLMRARHGDTVKATTEGMAFMAKLRESPEPQTISRPSGNYTFQRKEETHDPDRAPAADNPVRPAPFHE